jgi:hypothetical protein
MALNPQNIEPHKFKPGTSGNPAGRPPGIADKRSLSQMIREVMVNFDWSKSGLKDSQGMEEKFGKNAWLAIIYVATTKAAAGDNRAMDFLRKSGFGDMVDITSAGEKIDPIVIYRPEKLADDADTKAESR